MKTTEARDMRDSLAPPEGDLATTDEVGANKRKKKHARAWKCAGTRACRKRTEKTCDSTMSSSRLFASACLFREKKKTVVPTPHLRIQSHTDTQPSKKKNEHRKLPCF